jgi:hypothetical protein
MNMAIKNGIYKEKLGAYLKADKEGKGSILDAVIKVTGMHRKAALRRFNAEQMKSETGIEHRGRPRKYTTDVVAALKEVWESLSEACAENLHSQVGEYIDTQLRVHAWHHTDDATWKLRTMSLGSMKVYAGQFTRTRLSFGGKSTTQRSGLISMIPIRMDEWKDAEAGVTQIDTVAHCGHANVGDFVYTTNATDVATLWGTRRAQWNKGQEATKTSLEAMRVDSPFPWTEMHPDSGGEFINYILVAYAQEKGIRMTRSRPYHKNDNCFVEERNGHVIRVHVGFERFDAREVVDALNDLYDVLTPYLNHFVASGRIVSKQRVGAKWVIKREKVSMTPYQRVLARNDVSKENKEKLCSIHTALDPKVMKAEIDRLKKRVHDVQRRYGTK